MARYTLELRPAAERGLRQLDRQVQLRVGKAIDALLNEPRPAGAATVVGTPGWLRIRVGDYRIVYEVRNEELLVIVMLIGHRSSIYRRL